MSTLDFPPADRIDGRQKVTGTAKYAAEFNEANMAYAFPLRATIAKGQITEIKTGAAEKASGVLSVVTHLNAMRFKPINQQEQMKAGVALIGENLIPLQENKILYFGQFIALVVAETYEEARYAASLIEVSYAKEKHAIDLKEELPKGYEPEKILGEEAQHNKGKASAPLASAAHKIERTYTTPTENHHPMEPFATIAAWDADDKLSLYDATQGVMLTRAIAAYFLNLKPVDVKVISPFVGGGFGSKGLWLHILLAAMAAKLAKRPVKLVLTRQMMQTNNGRRAATRQKISLGAGSDGMLTVIRHHTESDNNLTQFFEPAGKQTHVLYAAPVREITYRIAKLNVPTPTFMRAPGETPGTFALESAMDELAISMSIDPVEFRLRNHTDIDPVKKLPFSSNYLPECYTTGAEKFGWSKRNNKSRQTRNGKYLVGYGMATATYPGNRSAASAKVVMLQNGDVKVMTAAMDIGTGMYTIAGQTASEALAVPLKQIKVELGNSDLPNAPLAGGSTLTASVTPAILSASETLRDNILQLALADKSSPLSGRTREETDFSEAGFYLKSDKSIRDSYSDIMRRNNKTEMEACVSVMPLSGAGLGSPISPCQQAPQDADKNRDPKKYSYHSFGAQFAEVWVDEDFGTIRVKRFTSVIDAGRILNEKTARSQIIGGITFGIGAALMEATHFDHRWGNPITRSFADYHVPVNLDVPEIDVHFIGKPDPHISSTGARGIGEIGITGVAAAIANAVFNATGKRLRDLPLTPQKVLAVSL